MALDQSHFQLTYEGDATREHTIVIEDYAPSLLALSRAVKAAQAVAAPGRPLASVQIKATAGGSFVVDLLVQVPGLIESGMDVLLSRHVIAAINASELLGMFAAAIGLMKWLRGKKRIERQENPDGATVITAQDGSQITVSSSVVNIVYNAQFRKAAEAMVKPLESRGIDSLRISSSDIPEAVIVTSDELDAFRTPEEDDEVEDILEPTEREAILTVDTVNFVVGNKWRLREGQEKISAEIQDPDFLSSVANGTRSFAANDTLRVTLVTERSMTSKGEKITRNIITKVHEHCTGRRQPPRPRQFTLPFPDS